MCEIWKDIIETDKYEVSNFGKIRNKKTKYILKPELIQKGYLRISLSNTGVRKLIHVLVAEAFLGEKPFDNAQVNHIDKNKTNNHIDNLEWCTPSENMKHGFDNSSIEKQKKRRTHMRNIGKLYGKDNAKIHSAKPVCQIDNNNNVVAVYNSAREACENSIFKYKSISQVCLGQRKTHKGYKWKFLNDLENVESATTIENTP